MWLSAKKYFWVLLVLCIILLILPLVIRGVSSDGLLIGEESYKNLRWAEGDSVSSYDGLSYGGKPHVEEKLWYSILSISPGFLVKFLPILLGILCFVLFYFLVSNIKPELKGFASILLITSPLFLLLFSMATKYVAAVFFILLGLYLMSIKKNKFGLVSLLFSGFFSIVGLFFVGLFFLFYYFKKKNYVNLFSLVLGFILVFLIQFYKIFSLGLPENLFAFKSFSFGNFFSFIIFELGGKYGLGLFLLILSLVGIYVYYNEKYKFVFYYLILFIFLLISFYLPFLLFYLCFILAFFAAVGLIPFFYGNWRSDVLKFLTSVILVCGLLFSVLVFYSNVPNLEPTSEQFEVIQFLKNQEEIISPVFASPKFGSYITYAGKSSFIDSNYLYAPDLGMREIDMGLILNSSNLDFAVDILNKHRIKYILVDKEMKRDVFNNEDEKFLFLLKFSPHKFVNLISNEDVELWYHRPL